MANKEEFKSFVKDNPKLVKYVRIGDMTWQKFYEMYDLYGSDNAVWKDYLGSSEVNKVTPPVAGVAGLSDLVGLFKNVDLDSIQNGVSSIQRVLGVLQDFNTKDNKPLKEAYKPRPVYKHFED